MAENTATSSVIDNGVITDTDTGNSFTCTLGGADAADFTCTISGNNAQLKFAAVPNYESAADADTNNVYIVTVLINDGVANDANGATTLTITVTDANDQTPTYSAGSTTPSIAEGVTAVDANVAITDTDSGDSNTCTLGGADAGDFSCTLTGQTAYSLAFSSAPDYDSPADADSNNIYVVTVTILSLIHI